MEGRDPTGILAYQHVSILVENDLPDHIRSTAKQYPPVLWLEEILPSHHDTSSSSSFYMKYRTEKTHASLNVSIYAC